MASAANSLGGVDVEQVVREVLTRLAAEQSKRGATEKTAAGVGTSASGGELSLAARLITIAELDGRLHGVQRLRLIKGAVITPAVRDLLRQRDISVDYAAANGRAAGHALALALAATAYEPAGLVRAIGQRGTAVERLAQIGLTGAVDELCDLVGKGGMLGLLLTEKPAAAACLANRRRGVRAASAGSVREVDQAVQSLGMNLLTIEPAGRGFCELQQMVRSFLRGGARQCPAELSEWLN